MKRKENQSSKLVSRILKGIGIWIVTALVIAIVGSALHLADRGETVSTIFSLTVVILPIFLAIALTAPKKKSSAPAHGIRPSSLSREPRTVTTPQNSSRIPSAQVSPIVSKPSPAARPIVETNIPPRSTATENEPNESVNSIVRSMRPSAVRPVAHTLPLFNADFIRKCKGCFISFDVETTGFSPNSDRIIEISAVRFKDFKVVDSFSTLINPGMHIPQAASKVNHIYDDDVINAPDERSAISAFCSFIGQDTLNGNVTLVAHNAMFDIKFLLHALSYCEIDADISFQDTLQMCRDAALNLENNKLGTVASHFGIKQESAHRAEDDARVCGEIFIHLLLDKEAELNAKLSVLTDDELRLCKRLKHIFDKANLNTQFLVFHFGTYLCCRCVYDALKFKSRAKIPYVLIKKDASIPEGMNVAPASKSEGEKFIRILYHDVSELAPLEPYFIKAYRETCEMAEKYIFASDRNLKDAAHNASIQISV